MSEKLIGVLGLNFVGTLAGRAVTLSTNVDISMDATFDFPDSPSDDPLYPNVADYYVSPTGSDSDAGTYKHPFKTWDYAASKAKAGDLIYIRGGVYYSDPEPLSWDAVHIAGVHGEPGNMIRMFAYPGETPVLDCSTMTSRNYISGFNFHGEYWHFKGLNVTGVPQFADSPKLTRGVNIRGKHNRFELFNSYKNMGMGFFLEGDFDDNVFVNCDAYQNEDKFSIEPTGGGGNADGFHVGPDNPNLSAYTLFIGCRSWENSDDGFDFYDANSIIELINCVSFRNGYHVGTWDKYGDGNGFKLGRTSAVDNVFRRILTGCVAFRNYSHGIGKATTVRHKLSENTTYNNGLRADGSYQAANLSMNGVAADLIVNNIALRDNGYNGSDFSPNADIHHNSWSLTGAQLPVNHFKSLDWTGIDGPRQASGSLPVIDFLRLKDTSAFKTAGVDGVSIGAY